MDNYGDLLREVALEIHDCGAFEVHLGNDQRQLISGETSRFYFNFRTPENPKPGPATQDMLKKIALLMSERMQRELIAVDLVAGIPNAGTPIARALAEVLGVPMLLMEKHGSGRDQYYSIPHRMPGHRVALVDDVLTNAIAKCAAIDALQEDGYEVPALCVIINREQGGTQALYSLANGITIVALYLMSSLLMLYREEKRGSSEESTAIREYLDSR